MFSCIRILEVFLFKQKTAFEIGLWLEFRRGVFRSPPGLDDGARRRIGPECLIVRSSIIITCQAKPARRPEDRSEEHTSELQSQSNLVCRLLLEKKKPHIRASAGQPQRDEPGYHKEC